MPACKTTTSGAGSSHAGLPPPRQTAAAGVGRLDGGAAAAAAGADWNGAWEAYGALLDHVVDEEELHTVMMMMIGQLNASHTGVSGGPPAVERTQQTRYPGFNLVTDASGFYKVGHVYKDGPADR